MNIRTDCKHWLIAAALAAPATVLAAENPETMKDESWVSISGTVTSVMDDKFLLDYADGSIVVEMDDWDSYGEAYALDDGDSVTVYGRVDNEFFADETIEASSVYVEDINSFFYASSADEEEVGEWALVPDVTVGEITYIGTVESVSPDIQELTLDTGATDLTVDTSPMLYNPLDDDGYQQIDVGDRVSIQGRIDNELFDGFELDADVIVTLSG